MEFYSKTSEIIKLCKGKKVLHLGCVGFADLPTEARIAQAKNSLHHTLSQCSTVTGIDYSKDAIEFFQVHNVFDNVVFGDAERLSDVNISDKFDVVVIGDLIEHLSNPGLMLEGVKRFCDSNSLIIVTTPNSFGVLAFVRYLIGKFKEGAEHVMCFNNQNIKTMLERNGYSVKAIDTCYQDFAQGYGLFFKVGVLVFRTFPSIGGTLFVKAKMGDK
ncbi:MAG: methyltransferase domain-containing protein [Methylophilaceae bacterium]